MTEDDFTRLRNHLEQVLPLVDQFCSKHNFERVEGSSIGRYPRIRLQRRNDTTFWLDLWMGLDSNGQRFSYFHPDIPYELSAGAFFDEQSSETEKWRYQKSFVIWPAKPFREVGINLIEALENALTTLQRWDRVFLRNEGSKTLLGQ